MPHVAAAALTLHPLGRHVVLLAWNGAASPGARRLRVRIGGVPARPPFTHVAVPVEGRSHRNLLAMRLDRQERAAAIAIAHSDGPVLAETAERTPSAAPFEFDAHALVDGVAAPDRARLIRFVLEVCGPLFRMSTDALFVGNARTLLAEASAGSGPLVARCTLTPDQVFCEGLVPDGIGEQLTAVLLAADGVHAVAARPGVFPPPSPRATASQGLGLVLPRKASAAGTRIVVFGENGLVCRTLGAVPRRLAGAHDWLLRGGRDTAAQRRFILDCLAQRRLGAAASSTLLRELSVLAPTDPRAQAQPPAAPHGAAELVIDCTEGLFIAGRLADPHRLADSLWITQGGVERQVGLQAAARFRCAGGSASAPGTEGPAEGFALFVPRRDGGAAGAPVQLALGLRSGARLAFGQGPAPLDPVAAEQAVLALLPGGAIPEPLLAAVETACGALLRERLADPPSPQLADFGLIPSRPATTVIVPFTADAGLLRCRMGLFATDPLLREVELLHVAAGAEAASAAEPLLGDLQAMYGLPTRLLMLDRPVPPGVALNLAVAASRGAALCFLGETAVPETPGWLRRMFDVLKARPQRAIVGAQVVHPDHSLVSAGAGIGVDAEGRWALRPLLAGFPRDYPPAAVPTRVAAVEPDCMLLRRALIADAGGFAEHYHLTASAHADLSLRARSRGLEVWRLPEPAVFRLAGAIAEDTAARTSVRQELDRRTLERRWRDAFDDTCTLPGRIASAAQPLPAAASAGAPVAAPATLTTQKAA